MQAGLAERDLLARHRDLRVAAFGQDGGEVRGALTPQFVEVPWAQPVAKPVQMVRQQLYMEQIHKKNFMLLVLLCTLNRLVMMSSGVSCSMLRSLTKKHSQLSKNTLRTLRAHFYTLCRE